MTKFGDDGHKRRSPKFSLQSISFSQITEKSAPEHHHFRVFGNFLPFQRPSCSKFLIFKPFCRRPRTVYCGQPERSEVIAGQNAAPETTNFTLEPAPETHLFTLKPARARARDAPFHAQPRSRPRQSPKCFTSPWHIPTKMW